MDGDMDALMIPAVLKEALRQFPSDRKKVTNSQKRKAFMLGASWTLRHLEEEITKLREKKVELENSLHAANKKSNYWHGLYKKGRL